MLVRSVILANAVQEGTRSAVCVCLRGTHTHTMQVWPRCLAAEGHRDQDQDQVVVSSCRDNRQLAAGGQRPLAALRNPPATIERALQWEASGARTTKLHSAPGSWSCTAQCHLG